MQVSLAPVTAETQVTVHHFFHNFFSDLSQWDENIALNPYGLPTWIPAGLPGPRTMAEFIEINWWERDTGVQYLIMADGNPAGYGLVFTRQSAFELPEGVDQELFDFYIAPKYRRCGVGAQAAPLIFDQHRGVWEVYQLAGNLPARTFWQKVVDAYTSGNFENLRDGTCQRFTNG